ncbi:glycosyltransferase [Zavarzinia sp. CC-PAN008]|uniref:glycosyltransferase n=1 Tax=Zavarzinia sp. CC-PAN008 TaxID=3243332 RepID=UPI003F7463A5
MTPAAASTAGPRCVAFWTRELAGQPLAGRLHVIARIREAMEEAAAANGGGVTHLRLPNLFERGGVLTFLVAGVSFLWHLLRLKPMALQCALFATYGAFGSLIAAIPAGTPVVYVDGVRSLAFLRALRKMRPDLRIVCDFDDLMSRRVELLLSMTEIVAPGYLSTKLPRILTRIVTAPLFGHMIARYELWSLRGAEREVLQLADAVNLLSSVDAQSLEVVRGRLGRRARATIAVTRPVVAVVAPPVPRQTPLRFVFIGTDGLTQNRLTIDHLAALWDRHRPTAELHLFGLMTRERPLPPGVFAHGYVDSLAQVYDARSILLSPSYIGGGVKTKVLEAFAWGIPVVGNRLTFEAMALDSAELADYPLLLDEAAMLELIRAPEAQLDRLDEAARRGAAYVAEHHDPRRFRRRWGALLGLLPGDGADLGTERRPGPLAQGRAAPT